MFHRILVAINDSRHEHMVFEQALSLAQLNQAELMMLHVLEPFSDNYLTGPYQGFSQATWDIYIMKRQEQEDAMAAQFQTLKGIAIAAGITPEFSQNVGSPGKVICEIAKNWNADLIVLGRHGRSGFSELFLGSVSNYVLHHARCHVLTVQGLHSLKGKVPTKIEAGMTL
jgi:nucleotide-binding universal stress UspA family protein